MTTLALVLCLALAAFGALGIASPSRLVAVARRLQSPRGMLVAAAIRVVLGVALFLAAPGSRAPEILRPLGLFIVLVGFVTPFFGAERFGRLLDWWSEQGSIFIRVWALVAMAFGLWLAYGVS